MTYYLEALKLSPTNSDVAYSIGAIYANQANYLEAKKYFEKAVNSNPNNVNAKDALIDMKDVISQNNVHEAIRKIEEQKYDEALVLLNRALTENSKNPDAYYYRGSVYDTQGKYQLAINDYKNSLKYNANQAVTYYLIAIDYENLKDITSALDYYKKFISMYKTEDEYSQYVKARIPEIEEELKKKNAESS